MQQKMILTKSINHSDLKKILAHHNNMIWCSKLASGPKYHQTKEIQVYLGRRIPDKKAPKIHQGLFPAPKGRIFALLGHGGTLLFQGFSSTSNLPGQSWADRGPFHNPSGDIKDDKSWLGCLSLFKWQVSSNKNTRFVLICRSPL